MTAETHARSVRTTRRVRSAPAVLCAVAAAVLAAPSAAQGPAGVAASGEATSGERLMAGLGCAACHAGVPAAASAAPPLSPGGAYDPVFLFRYLARPWPLQPGARTGGRMPDFRLSADERLALTRYLAGAERVAAAVPRAGWLQRLLRRPVAVGGDTAALARALRHDSAADAAAGRRIFLALNCAGCHPTPGVRAWRAGPSLAAEAGRARAAWLRRYLRAPAGLRPEGFVPGSRSRMPDFGLDPDEADAVAAALLRGAGDGASPRARDSLRSEPLSAFRRGEVEALLRRRLPCLGCHRLDRDGGRIGPDLSAVGARRPEAYIRAVISDPTHATPGSIMPRVPLQPQLLGALVRYLAGRREAEPDTAALPSLVVAAPTSPAQSTARGPAALYARTCAPCHGVAGEGDGLNAPFLPVPPARHASAQAMSLRTDDMLFDAIYVGGQPMGRSPRMPPFGETLTREEIRGLVGYIRRLCRCQGPAWSRDDGGAP